MEELLELSVSHLGCVECEAARRRVLTQRAGFINAVSVTKAQAASQLELYVQKLA